MRTKRYRTKTQWAELAEWADKKAAEFERSADAPLPDHLKNYERKALLDAAVRDAVEGRRFRAIAENARVKAHTGSEL